MSTVQHDMSTVQHDTSTVQHDTSITQHDTSTVQHGTSTVQHIPWLSVALVWSAGSFRNMLPTHTQCLLLVLSFDTALKQCNKMASSLND